MFSLSDSEHLLIKFKKQFWTLGGGTRKRQLSGARKFSYYSWAICQRLDGTPTATETVEIPTREVRLEGKRKLSTSESRSLFNKILQCMTGEPYDEADQTNQSESSFRSPGHCSPCSQVIVLPTPPTLPGHQLSQLQQLQHLPKKAPTQEQRPLPLPSPWQGIFELSGRINGRYILRKSLIHPQELALTRTKLRQSLLPSVETASKDIDRSKSNNVNKVYSTREPFVCNTRESSAHHTRDSSPSRAEASDEELCNQDTPSSECSEMIGAAEILVEMSRNVYLDATSPREAWEAHKPTENPMFTALCTQRDAQCPYTILSTRLHYHCPPEKCKLSRPSSNPSQQEGALQDVYDPDHTHCVSRLGAFPDSAGECHLQNSRSRFPNHKCCYWDEEDLKTVPTRGQRSCESKKLEEARKKGLRILDRRVLVGNWLDVEREVTMMGLSLDDGGKELEAALNGGLHEVEIARYLFAAEH